MGLDLQDLVPGLGRMGLRLGSLVCCMGIDHWAWAWGYASGVGLMGLGRVPAECVVMLGVVGSSPLASAMDGEVSTTTVIVSPALPEDGDTERRTGVAS